MSDSNNTTDFGFENVPVAEKAQRVANVFRSVASNYDVMNDAMSMGLHRLWKRFAISQAHINPGQKALDLAGGTGDLTLLLAKKMQYKGQIVLSDINESMLAEGKDRLTDAGILEPVEYVQANAENLPFADNHFDLITIAFGLRNVTDKDKALRSMYRVLKPGGQLLVLEFSKPTGELLNKAYDMYSFNVLPTLGKMIANDGDSYRYLAESIRMHPPQKELKNMMETAGFEDCDYHNLSAGIVALHKGYKF